MRRLIYVGSYIRSICIRHCVWPAKPKTFIISITWTFTQKFSRLLDPSLLSSIICYILTSCLCLEFFPGPSIWFYLSLCLWPTPKTTLSGKWPFSGVRARESTERISHAGLIFRGETGKRGGFSLGALIAPTPPRGPESQRDCGGRLCRAQSEHWTLELDFTDSFVSVAGPYGV